MATRMLASAAMEIGKATDRTRTAAKHATVTSEMRRINPSTAGSPLCWLAISQVLSKVRVTPSDTRTVSYSGIVDKNSAIAASGA